MLSPPCRLYRLLGMKHNNGNEGFPFYQVVQIASQGTQPFSHSSLGKFCNLVHESLENAQCYIKDYFLCLEDKNDTNLKRIGFCLRPNPLVYI